MGNENNNKKNKQKKNIIQENIFLDDAEDLGATYNITSNSITKAVHSSCPFCKLEFNLTSSNDQLKYKNHVFDCQKKNNNKPKNIIEFCQRCPKCNQIFFNPNLFNNHINICGKNNQSVHIEGLTIEEQNMINQDLKKKELPLGNPKGTFEEKVEYIRYNIQNLKVDWSSGAEKINIERDKIIEQSMEQFKTINLYKELKINFKGEESHDAGGLIREWLTVLFKAILDPANDLFERGDTDEVTYICKPNLKLSQQQYDKYFFIGKVLAKALLENLTVNCCFNKIIYQLFLNEKIVWEKDLVFIDKPLYNSLKNLVELKNENPDSIETFGIYFSIQSNSGFSFIDTIELISNGNSILVTKDNLNVYIEKRIDYLIKSQKPSVDALRKGFSSIISLDQINNIFTSDQLNLLINGTPFIDVDDWRMNTIYQNYTPNDPVIINFWNIIYYLSQEELSNFLLFCTGSSRVPVGGFQRLESNRGNINKFCITKCEYNINDKNFIRAHTCFNRIDLPNFPNIESLHEAIKFALENEVLGFGIE